MVAKRCLVAAVVILALVLAVVVALFLWHVLDKGAATAETESGKIHGHVVWGPGGEYIEEYLGIPYAYPPVNELRWAKPMAYKEYDGGSWDATEMKNACWGWMDPDEEFEGETMWYPKTDMSEDCLYLNVWVPRPKRTNRAVMVWIHGGALQSGSSSVEIYNGRALAEAGDVVVVSINYRVGVFGFLSTGDSRVKGNYGLLDQREALRWVKKNIHHFDGDPNLVTIFGESAGSMSVGFLALSTANSENLFKRIIQQSGSANSHVAMMSNSQAKSRSEAYFGKVGCDADDDAVLDCLRKLPAEKAWKNSYDMPPKDFFFFPWMAVVDGEFLTKTSHHLLQDGDYPRYDSMVGVTKNEGSYFIQYLENIDRKTSSELTRNQLDEAIENALWELQAGVRTDAKTAYERALPKASGADRRDLLEQLFGDWNFVCPSVNLTWNYTEHGSKVFFYQLTYRASNSLWPEWMGVLHGDDIQWVFGEALRRDDPEKKPYTDDEKQFAKDIITYWSNFAKYGDPNGGDLPYWPQYALDGPAYLELGNGTTFQPHKEQLPSHEFCNEWAEENRRYFNVLN